MIPLQRYKFCVELSIMRETKKQSNLMRRLSILIPVILIAIFVYMNFRETGHSTDGHLPVQQLEMITTKAALPWADTEQEIINSVYYGTPADLNKPIVMTESGQYRSIGVEDVQEEIIDLAIVNNPRIRPISELDATQQVVSSRVRKSVYDGLLRMLDKLPEQIGIAYYRGFVPLKDQHAAFDTEFDATKAGTLEEAFNIAWIHVEPVIENVPAYSTGAVIDMTLFSAGVDSKKLLDLGQYGARNSQTFGDVDDVVRQNRVMLLKATADAGFVNYGMQWWRFSIGDKMWAYVRNKKSAMFGLIEKSYTPPFESRADYLDSKDSTSTEDTEEDYLPVLKSIGEWDEFLAKNPDKFIVARFFATGCKKCEGTAARFGELVEPGAVYVNVDLKDAKELQNRYDFKGKPHFLVFYKGQNILKIADIDEVPNAVRKLIDAQEQNVDEPSDDDE